MRGAAGNLSAPIPRVAFSKAGRAEVVPCPRAGAQPPTTRPTRAWALGAPPAELGDAQAEDERLKARAEQRARARSVHAAFLREYQLDNDDCPLLVYNPNANATAPFSRAPSR